MDNLGIPCIHFLQLKLRDDLLDQVHTADIFRHRFLMHILRKICVLYCNLLGILPMKICSSANLAFMYRQVLGFLPARSKPYHHPIIQKI